MGDLSFTITIRKRLLQMIEFPGIQVKRHFKEKITIKERREEYNQEGSPNKGP